MRRISLPARAAEQPTRLSKRKTLVPCFHSIPNITEVLLTVSLRRCPPRRGVSCSWHPLPGRQANPFTKHGVRSQADSPEESILVSRSITRFHRDGSWTNDVPIFLVPPTCARSLAYQSPPLSHSFDIRLDQTSYGYTRESVSDGLASRISIFFPSPLRSGLRSVEGVVLMLPIPS